MTRASVTAISAGVMVAMLLAIFSRLGMANGGIPSIRRQMRQRLPADRKDEEGNEGLPRERLGSGQTR